MVNLQGKSFLTLMDFTKEEILYLLDLAQELKEKKKKGILGKSLQGKNIALVFEKTSTRTRCAFETACLDEGGNVSFLDSSTTQMGKKESIEDSAKVLGRFFDGIEYRGSEQIVVEKLSKFSQVPVWNGLTDVDHPTQILADLLTIKEHCKKPLEQVKVVFCGDVRNNMSYAWMYGCSKLGMNFVAYGPDELIRELDQEILAKVKEQAKASGGSITISSSPECLDKADVIYTDVWASMGEENQIPQRVQLLSPYKVTMELLQKTNNPQVLFLHCLPAFHDFETGMAKEQKELGYDIREVTDEVFHSVHSKVFDEAENRMHTIKAVMVATLGCPEAGE